jgi:hypothetical protein
LTTYKLEHPKLTPFTLQLNQAVFYLLSLSDHQRSKPVNQDIQLQRCKGPTGRGNKMAEMFLGSNDISRDVKGQMAEVTFL